MKTVFNVRRLATAVAASVSVVGLVSVTYPGGLAAACQDVADTPRLSSQMAAATTERDGLNCRSIMVADRIELKETLITQLLDGQSDLETTARQFAELNADMPKLIRSYRLRYGDRPDDELAARSVLEYAESRKNERPDGYRVVESLQHQFAARYGRVAVR